MWSETTRVERQGRYEAQDLAHGPAAAHLDFDHLFVFFLGQVWQLDSQIKEHMDVLSSDRKTVGKYYAGPTWEAADGSKVTGKQVAVAPATAGGT